MVIQGLKGMNLVRCWNHNMFGFSDDILPKARRPDFLSIALYKAYIFGLLYIIGSISTQRFDSIYQRFFLNFKYVGPQ